MIARVYSYLHEYDLMDSDFPVIGEEVVVGEYQNQNGGTTRIKADIVANIGGNSHNIDVAVIAAQNVDGQTVASLVPTAAEIEARLASDRPTRRHAQGHIGHPISPALDGLVHEAVNRVRTQREMMIERSILRATLKEELDKHRHYGRGQAPVYPFVITAHGTLGTSAKSLLDLLVDGNARDVIEKIRLRDTLCQRISVSLITYAHKMYQKCVWNVGYANTVPIGRSI